MTLSPTGVAYEIVSGGDVNRDALGLVPHEVRFWDTADRQRDGIGKYRITAIDGDRASDLMNSFKMQIRENHQRVVTMPGDIQEPDGYTRHIGGLAIPNRVIADPDELGIFLTGNGLPLSGYAPFSFPNYAGVEELLDGMWQHETHTVLLLGQVEANIENYIAVAKREAWEGDKRGTTINLQVGASADDVLGGNLDPVLWNTTSGAQRFGSFSATAFGYTGVMRFTSVDIPKGDIIESSDMTLRVQFLTDGTTCDGDFDALADDDASMPADYDAYVAFARTNRVAWNNVGTWNANDTITTPEIKIVVQDIVNRGGWASGNALVMTLNDDDESSSDGARRDSRSYDSGSSFAAKLNITHLTPTLPILRQGPVVS